MKDARISSNSETSWGQDGTFDKRRREVDPHFQSRIAYEI